MPDNVVKFTGVTRLDSDPKGVLEGALERGLEGVVICGYTASGDEYFASSYANGPDVLWLLERMKMKLLEVPDTYEG